MTRFKKLTSPFFYQGDFAAADKIFAEISPHDPVAAAYLKKCKLYQSDHPQERYVVWKVTEIGIFYHNVVENLAIIIPGHRFYQTVTI